MKQFVILDHWRGLCLELQSFRVPSLHTIQRAVQPFTTGYRMQAGETLDKNDQDKWKETEINEKGGFHFSTKKNGAIITRCLVYLEINLTWKISINKYQQYPKNTNLLNL